MIESTVPAPTVTTVNDVPGDTIVGRRMVDDGIVIVLHVVEIETETEIAIAIVTAVAAKEDLALDHGTDVVATCLLVPVPLPRVHRPRRTGERRRACHRSIQECLQLVTTHTTTHSNSINTNPNIHSIPDNRLKY